MLCRVKLVMRTDCEAQIHLEKHNYTIFKILDKFIKFDNL